MFGADAKVSLHASGNCQWSNTNAWVRKDAGRRNQDRHIVRWFEPRPEQGPLLHAFQVRIPETELRPIEDEKKLANVECSNLSSARLYLAQASRFTKTIGREMKPRAAVEPVIGHVKAEHRLKRNYLKGHHGDRANAILAAAGYNFSLLLLWLAALLRALFLAVLRYPLTAPAV